MPNAQFFNSDNQLEAQRRMRLAKVLQQASEAPQAPAGTVVADSPWAGLARGIAGGIGAYQENQADEVMAKDITDRQRFLQEAIMNAGNDTGKLSDTLLSNPAYMDDGLKLRMEGIKAEQEAAQWEKDAGLKRELAGMRNNNPQPYIDDNGEIVMPAAKLDAAEKKAFNEAEAIDISLQRTLDNLSKAEDLASKPMYSGFGSTAAAFMDRLPVVGKFVDDEKAANTTAYNNLITSEQLQKLQATFPGAISNAEREAMVSLGALSSYTPEQRVKILENAKSGARKYQSLMRGQMQGIASRDRYTKAANYKEGEASPPPAGNTQLPDRAAAARKELERRRSTKQ